MQAQSVIHYMNLIKSLIFLLFLSSCVEVGFKHPQPTKGKNLSEVPKEMIEFYSDIKSDSSSTGIKDWYSTDDFDKSLSETTILKKWKGKYFLNEKEDSLWHIIMIVPISDNRFETYLLDGENEKTIKILKEITKVEEQFSEDGELKSIIIDPSSREFNKIVKSKAFTIIEIF